MSRLQASCLERALFEKGALFENHIDPSRAPTPMFYAEVLQAEVLQSGWCPGRNPRRLLSD
jgi:hypothetical protein